MKFRPSLLPLGAALLLTVGCLRSYNAVPLTHASLLNEAKSETGLVLKTKAFLTPAEVSERFGTKLAEERQVIPVQVLIANTGTESFRILRANFVIEETQQKVKLDALSLDQMYELGRHGYGAPVCGLIFGGVLGLPSLITTMNANDKLRDDYGRKLIQDAIVEPGKEVAGAVFFDPQARNLNRTGHYKLIVEVQNTKTNAKTTLEQSLS